jgi:hypothetical protein
MHCKLGERQYGRGYMQGQGQRQRLCHNSLICELVVISRILICDRSIWFKLYLLFLNFSIIVLFSHKHLVNLLL